MNIQSYNKTKIVATLGPASSSKEMILELIMAGVDIFRLNFSHGTHEQHLESIKIIKSLNKKFNVNVGILQDLQGPKIRIGTIKNGAVEIKDGNMIVITTQNVEGDENRIQCNYEGLPQDVKPGDMILIDDGKIELKALEVKKDEISCKIIHGGTLKPKKGLNLPNTDVSIPSLTKKDREDLMFGLENDVDWIALSFVRTHLDVAHLKSIIKEKGKKTKVISKIEKPEALVNIDAIIAESDGLMVARGDLGVEIIMEEVPMHQKNIVAKSNTAAKPVIIATQMMESMIQNPRPTRAETSDIANSVLDGADALMLSAETASGLYPVETVQSMVRAIASVETQAKTVYNKFPELNHDTTDFASKSIVQTACRLAKDTKAKAIIGMTTSGFTAFQLASHRPEANIFIFTDNMALLSTINLLWGVRGFYYDKYISTDSTINDLEQYLLKHGHLTPGDIYINTASMPMGTKGRTNMVKISIAGNL